MFISIIIRYCKFCPYLYDECVVFINNLGKTMTLKAAQNSSFLWGAIQMIICVMRAEASSFQSPEVRVIIKDKTLLFQALHEVTEFGEGIYKTLFSVFVDESKLHQSNRLDFYWYDPLELRQQGGLHQLLYDDISHHISNTLFYMLIKDCGVFTLFTRLDRPPQGTDWAHQFIPTKNV